MARRKTLTWVWTDGKVYECGIEPGLCPLCLADEAVVELPPPLKAQQPDGTTHVCHPMRGGCNHGFKREVQS